MYFIHYFYVTVTDAAPKCPGAELAAPSWPRRIGGAELSHSGTNMVYDTENSFQNFLFIEHLL